MSSKFPSGAHVGPGATTHSEQCCSKAPWSSKLQEAAATPRTGTAEVTMTETCLFGRGEPRPLRMGCQPPLVLLSVRGWGGKWWQKLQTGFSCWYRKVLLLAG